MGRSGAGALPRDVFDNRGETKAITDGQGYTLLDIMQVDLHEHAVEDIRALRRTDPSAAAAVLVALAEIEADPRIIDKLTTHGNNAVGSNTINVKAWQHARSRTQDLWRFRVLDTPATSYRVVYGYHWATRQVVVLAVVHKEHLNYDDLTSDLSRRILADWRAV